MSKPRLNANVAKLIVGEPVRWSASGIGTVALDNAVQAGHIVFVDMVNPDEFYIMRPAAGQLDTMIKTETSFGTTVYSFPVIVEATPVVEVETVSIQKEAPMITNTPADRADAALSLFASAADADYNDTADQIADLIASSHHLARRLGLDWKSILADATKRYADTKPVATVAKVNKTPKASKPERSHKATSEAVPVWTLEVELPSSVIANAQRSKPYSHAAMILVAGQWSVFAWVSSKETASKRIGDAKRSGIVVEAHRVGEVRIVASPEASGYADRLIAQERAAEQADEYGEEYEEAIAQQEEQEAGARLADDEPTADDPYQIEQTALGQAIITNTWPRTEELIGLPFEPSEAEQQEISREVEIDEPMHVKIKGGTAVHLSDDGEETYCGIQRDDMRQVEDAITCRSCEKVAGSRAAKA